VDLTRSDNNFDNSLVEWRLIKDSELVTELGLPEHLRATMLAASNGEIAWPIEHAVDAVTWIASKDLAVLGGEAWLVDDAGRISGLIPVEDSNIAAVRGWDVEDRRPNESWSDFVERCRRQAVAALQAESTYATREIPATARPQLIYSVTFEAKA
jgi:hypothetical protein